MSVTLHRPRLIKYLDDALQQGHVAIIAPGGYGKTTLLRALAVQRPDSYYFLLSPADADLTVLQARLAGLTTQPNVTLLLDDMQHLAHASETLNWLGHQLTTGKCRFVLSGRQVDLSAFTEPLTSFTMANLAFTPQESRTLLKSHRANTAAAWHARAAGWPLALAMLSQLPNDTSLDALPVESPLFDHLARAFFADLPPDLLRFLQTTAIPLSFNLELAALLLNAAESAAHTLLAEAQRRSLFLQAIEPPGWFRYHELVRDFLLTTAPFDLKPLYEKVVDWFDGQGNFELAIEHALPGQLYSRAVELILSVSPTFVREQGRHLTYRRWVLSLPDSVLAEHPALLVHLGQHLFSVRGYLDEAWQHVKRAITLAEQTGDQNTALQARVRQGFFHYRSGNYEQARLALQPLLADPALTGPDRRLALRLYCNALGEMARYREARRAYREAIQLAQAENDLEEELFNRQNLAITTLTPLGDFDEAQAHMQAALDHYTNAPGLRLRCLLMSCDVHFLKGDWAALKQTLQEMDALSHQLDVVETADQLWPSYYRALLETGLGNFSEARKLLERFSGLIINDYSMARISEAWLEMWLLRREGRLAEATQKAEAVLAGNIAIPYYRAQIAMYGVMARWSLSHPADSPLAFPSEIRNFIHWRARADLVHLRALLALECWRLGNPRWQRHARAVLRALRRPGYERLLITRDPELGAAFWTMCLAADFAIEQATAALVAIGQIEPVAALLDLTPQPPLLLGEGEQLPSPLLGGIEGGLEGGVKLRAAAALAAIGNEAAIPALEAALKSETDPAVAAALEAAISRLETIPPPPLEIQLLGGFAVQRDGRPVTAWPRPIVRRLLQYFALHRGQTLPRDQILDDLWPDADPASAYSTFRTVHSRLRSVLEPYLRPKVPARYFAVEGDTYHFDPLNRVRVDVEQFEQTVRAALNEAGQHDIPLLPDDLLAALENWRPLLPDLPYEEWVISRREALHALYVEGCLYVAEAYLTRSDLREAMQWARRCLAQAPWLEEAYQIVMRGHARLDERALALKVYETAVAALERELGAPPSRLTAWLAERLRRGEEI